MLLGPNQGHYKVMENMDYSLGSRLKTAGTNLGGGSHENAENSYACYLGVCGHGPPQVEL